MKRIILVLVSVSLSILFVAHGHCKTYDNPKIGLAMTYPETWQSLNKNEAAPQVILTLIKLRNKVDVDLNPHIKVIAAQIPEEEWRVASLNGTLNEQIHKMRTSVKGAIIKTNTFPLKSFSDLHNFSIQIPFKGRTLTQYQYVYWHPPFYVQVVCSFSDQADEMEIKDIIRSMRIQKTNTPIGHAFHVPAKTPYATEVSNSVPTRDNQSITSKWTLFWKYSDAYFLSKSDYTVDGADRTISDVVRNAERNIVVNFELNDIITRQGSHTKVSYPADIFSRIKEKAASELQYSDIQVVDMASSIALE